MTDYISREAAICRLREAIPYHDNSITGLERAIGYLQALPAANVREVVKEKWREGVYAGYRCPVCITTWDCKTNFCPNCGADMREEQT